MLFDDLSSLLTYYSKRNSASKANTDFPPLASEVNYTRIGDSTVPGGAFCIPEEIEA